MCRWKSRMTERQDGGKRVDEGGREGATEAKWEQERAIDCRLGTCHSERKSSRQNQMSLFGKRLPGCLTHLAEGPLQLSSAIPPNIHQHSSLLPRVTLVWSKHMQGNWRGGRCDVRASRRSKRRRRGRVPQQIAWVSRVSLRWSVISTSVWVGGFSFTWEKLSERVVVFTPRPFTAHKESERVC